MFKRFIAPLRVLSLLDINDPADQRLKSELQLDCLRTENDDDWFLAIYIIAEHAPILILDATATTPGVLREYQHVKDDRLEYKSIFLSGRNGECPLFYELKDSGREHSSTLFVADELTALAIIKRILASGELPTREQPIGSVPSGTYNSSLFSDF